MVPSLLHPHYINTNVIKCTGYKITLPVEIHKYIDTMSFWTPEISKLTKSLHNKLYYIAVMYVLSQQIYIVFMKIV